MRLPCLVAMLILSGCAPSQREQQALCEEVMRIGDRSMEFYKHPSEQEFTAIFRDLTSHEKEMQNLDGTFSPMVVWSYRAIAKYGYDVSYRKNSDFQMLVSDLVAKKAKNLLAYIEDDRQIDTQKLDIWWASFFATGETKYLAKILLVASEPKRPNVIDLTVSSAQWSFKANCKQQVPVLEFAKSVADDHRFDSSYIAECIAYATSAEP